VALQWPIDAVPSMPWPERHLIHSELNVKGDCPHSLCYAWYWFILPWLLHALLAGSCQAAQTSAASVQCLSCFREPGQMWCPLYLKRPPLRCADQHTSHQPAVTSLCVPLYVLLTVQGRQQPQQGCVQFIYTFICACLLLMNACLTCMSYLSCWISSSL